MLFKYKNPDNFDDTDAYEFANRKLFDVGYRTTLEHHPSCQDPDHPGCEDCCKDHWKDDCLEDSQEKEE